MGLEFIAHDLSVVKYISDRVIVMYLDTIVEQAPAEELYQHSAHPYTQALLSSIPKADPEKARSEERIRIKGEVPSPINPPECCRIAERCPKAQDICRKRVPETKTVGEGHTAACHFV